jgi:fluoride exporter
VVTGDDGDEVPDSHGELPIDPDADPGPLHWQASALLLVFCGGVLGTALRYAAEDLLPHDGSRWPWATFAVNLTGAFVLGALLEGLARSGDDAGWRRRARLFAGTGFCGAFTTYSAFALEISVLGKGSHFVTAVGYGLASVVGGVILAWLGIVLADGIHRRRVRS